MSEPWDYAPKSALATTKYSFGVNYNIPNAPGFPERSAETEGELICGNQCRSQKVAGMTGLARNCGAEIASLIEHRDDDQAASFLQPLVRTGARQIKVS